jgi:TRAP-type C4-dicarboxylate transport system permease small subunit
VSLRKVNDVLGTLEGLLVTVFFATLVGVGAGNAIMGELFGKHIQGADEIVRYMVFFVAMTGAAMTASRLRMIGMDVLAHVLSPRGRAVARLFATVLVVFVAIISAKVGLDVRASQMALAGTSYEYIPPSVGMLAFPIGVVLIGLHYTLHAIIDVLYLIRGLVPPVREEAPV